MNRLSRKRQTHSWYRERTDEKQQCGYDVIARNVLWISWGLGMFVRIHWRIGSRFGKPFTALLALPYSSQQALVYETGV